MHLGGVVGWVTVGLWWKLSLCGVLESWYHQFNQCHTVMDQNNLVFENYYDHKHYIYITKMAFENVVVVVVFVFYTVFSLRLRSHTM